MKRSIIGFCLAFIGFTCSQPEVDKRTRKGKGEIGSSDNVQADGLPQPASEPSTTDFPADIGVSRSNQPLALGLSSEIDTTGMDQDFLSSVLALHKISATKTIIFGKNNTSWLLDDSKQGVMDKLKLASNLALAGSVFVLEKGRFWLLEAANIGYPSIKPSTDLGQITLLNIVPEIVKKTPGAYKTLFIGSNQLILTSDSRANIVTLDEDKARIFAFDFPKMREVAPAIFAAGIGTSDRVYWFMSSEQLFILTKNDQGDWSWLVAPFKLALPAEAGDAELIKVAMVVELKQNREVQLVGKTLVQAGAKLYTTEPVKLSVFDEKTAAISAAFTSTVLPIINTHCTSCHAAYVNEAEVRTHATAFKTHLTNKTMPPAPTPALLDSDSRVILDWFASIPL